MNLIAVSIEIEPGSDPRELLDRVRLASANGAALVEWRIDQVADEPGAVELIRQLVRESPVPVILTCRPAWEGGSYQGNDQDRVALLEACSLDDAAPRYVDFELAAYDRSANIRQKIDLVVDHPAQVRDIKASLILSSHDMDGRPADLTRRIETMMDMESCSVVKIAWHARSVRDNLEAFELLRQRRKPMVALCMGPFGLMSRVLAPKFGGLFTFASESEDSATAPGQQTIETMRSLYRYDSIGSATRVYGIIGWPVEHSLSPLLHNTVFDQVQHDGVMVRMPVPPEWEHFKATLASVLDYGDLDLSGASVTMPHKTHLLRFISERGGQVDPIAEIAGAANTLVIGDDGVPGCINTDAPGLVHALKQGLSSGGSDLSDARVTVLGSGGMARAAAAGLLREGSRVTLACRSPESARQLKVLMGDSIESITIDEIDTGSFDVLINCTPVGMSGGEDPDSSPLPADVGLDDSSTVMDTIYTPMHTPLLVSAAESGARVITADGLFIRQAELQSRAWLDSEPPTGLMDRVFRSASP